MNRHRQYWSVMGVEPNPDKKAFSQEALKKELMELIQIYSFNGTVKMLRQIKEEHPDICEEKKTLFL